MKTEQWQKYGYWLNKQLYDAQTNTSDVEEIRDQQRKRNELPGIHRPSRPSLCWKTKCCKTTWRNWREKRGACTHCGQQLNEYSALATPPLPIPYPPKYLFIFRADTSLFFCCFIFENLMLHIFLIIIIIIRFSGMFHVPGFIDGQTAVLDSWSKIFWAYNLRLDSGGYSRSNLNSYYLSGTLWFFYLFLLCAIRVLVKYGILTQYGLSSCKRPPRLDILDGRLREVRLYLKLS